MRACLTQRPASALLAVLISAAFLLPVAAQPSSPTSDPRFDAVRESIATSHKSIRAVVVSRADQQIFEHYRRDIDPEKPADVFAVSKSPL